MMAFPSLLHRQRNMMMHSCTLASLPNTKRRIIRVLTPFTATNTDWIFKNPVYTRRTLLTTVLYLPRHESTLLGKLTLKPENIAAALLTTQVRQANTTAGRSLARGSLWPAHSRRLSVMHLWPTTVHMPELLLPRHHNATSNTAQGLTYCLTGLINKSLVTPEHRVTYVNTMGASGEASGAFTSGCSYRHTIVIFRSL